MSAEIRVPEQNHANPELANPELTNHEHNTVAYVETVLRDLGIHTSRPTETSLIGTLHGVRPGPIIALRSELDALPVQEETGLPFASTVPGVIHGCGHDAHMAMLLGTAEVRRLRKRGARVLPAARRRDGDDGLPYPNHHPKVDIVEEAMLDGVRVEVQLVLDALARPRAPVLRG